VKLNFPSLFDVVERMMGCLVLFNAMQVKFISIGVVSEVPLKRIIPSIVELTKFG